MGRKTFNYIKEGGNQNPSKFLYMEDELSCGVAVTHVSLEDVSLVRI